MEIKGDTTAALLTQASATLERITHQLDDHESRLREAERRPPPQVEDHEKRLRAAEKQPGLWWERLCSALLSALVAAIISFLLQGGSV